jgi:transposase-like protein
MEIKEQIIQEYLSTGCGYRKLQKKYGVSRTTICKWVQVYQGIHNLAPTDLQQKHFINPMERKEKNSQDASSQKEQELLQKNCFP